MYVFGTRGLESRDWGTEFGEKLALTITLYMNFGNTGGVHQI
jgi:hypothetical protein